MAKRNNLSTERWNISPQAVIIINKNCSIFLVLKNDFILINWFDFLIF